MYLHIGKAANGEQSPVLPGIPSSDDLYTKGTVKVLLVVHKSESVSQITVHGFLSDVAGHTFFNVPTYNRANELARVEIFGIKFDAKGDVTVLGKWDVNRVKVLIADGRLQGKVHRTGALESIEISGASPSFNEYVRKNGIDDLFVTDMAKVFRRTK